MRSRAEQAEARLAEAREQVTQAGRSRDGALAELREQSARRAAFEAVASGIPDLQKEVEARSLGLAQLQRTVLELTRDKQALAATLDAERKGVEEKLQPAFRAKGAPRAAFH